MLAVKTVLFQLRRSNITPKFSTTSSFYLSKNMSSENRINDNQDKKLFTPGPLVTSASVKRAMMMDLGSRDTQFINVIKYIQTKLLDVAGLSQRDDYATVLMQGSGTFGVESVIQTATKHGESNYLVLENGAYGKRMGNICKLLGISHHVENFPEHRSICLDRVEKILQQGKQFTHVVSLLK
jgi:2-aminoethylphosphonate-pyruvate transaminase